MGMIQQSKDFGFTLEASHTLCIAGKRFRQDFQGHVAAEARIPRARYTSPIPPAPSGATIS